MFLLPKRGVCGCDFVTTLSYLIAIRISHAFLQIPAAVSCRFFSSGLRSPHRARPQFGTMSEASGTGGAVVGCHTESYCACTGEPRLLQAMLGKVHELSVLA